MPDTFSQILNSCEVSPPDEYFDNEMENDKEFLDIASSIYKGGIENITTVNVKILHFNKKLFYIRSLGSVNLGKA